MCLGAKSNTRSKRITVFDIFLICFLAVISLFPYFARRSGVSENPHSVEIITGTGSVQSFPLDRDGHYTVSGPLGETVIEVCQRRVRVKTSVCPTKVCVREGWKDKAGQIILCAPNRVAVYLTGGQGELDAVTR